MCLFFAAVSSLTPKRSRACFPPSPLRTCTLRRFPSRFGSHVVLCSLCAEGAPPAPLGWAAGWLANCSRGGGVHSQTLAEQFACVPARRAVRPRSSASAATLLSKIAGPTPEATMWAYGALAAGVRFAAALLPNVPHMVFAGGCAYALQTHGKELANKTLRMSAILHATLARLRAAPHLDDFSPRRFVFLGWWYCEATQIPNKSQTHQYYTEWRFEATFCITITVYALVAYAATYLAAAWYATLPRDPLHLLGGLLQCFILFKLWLNIAK